MTRIIETDNDNDNLSGAQRQARAQQLGALEMGRVSARAGERPNPPTSFTDDEIRYLAESMTGPVEGRVYDRAPRVQAAVATLRRVTDSEKLRLGLNRNDGLRYDLRPLHGVLPWGQASHACGGDLELARRVLRGVVPVLCHCPARAILGAPSEHYHVDATGRKWIQLVDAPLDRDLADKLPSHVDAVERPGDLVPCWPGAGCHVVGAPVGRWGLVRVNEVDRFALLPSTHYPNLGGVLPWIGPDGTVSPGVGVLELARCQAGDDIVREHRLAALISPSSIWVFARIAGNENLSVMPACWEAAPGDLWLRATTTLDRTGTAVPETVRVPLPGCGCWLSSGENILTARRNGATWQVTLSEKQLASKAE